MIPPVIPIIQKSKPKPKPKPTPKIRLEKKNKKNILPKINTPIIHISDVKKKKSYYKNSFISKPIKLPSIDKRIKYKSAFNSYLNIYQTEYKSQFGKYPRNFNRYRNKLNNN